MGKGLAILGVPVMRGGPKTLVVTSFTQSLGAELLTNGDFSAWTGDNPDGWTVTGESGGDPEVTERAPTALHGDAVGAGGACNFYRTVAGAVYITQTVCTVGKWYEVANELTARAAGEVASVQPFGFFAWGTTVTTRRFLGRATNTAVNFYNTATAIDLTIDNASAKLITLNVQQVMPANAIVDFTYALPASPAAYNTISVFYRISDASLEAGYNCWRAYIQRNAANTAWDFRLDSINAGTATNRINVTGVGDTVGFRVRCNGTLHDCWTTANGTDWTTRGSQVNVSWNDSATGINTIYCTGTTPTKLTATPV
jgi:hypothetical protein